MAKQKPEPKKPDPGIGNRGEARTPASRRAEKKRDDAGEHARVEKLSDCDGQSIEIESVSITTQHFGARKGEKARDVKLVKINTFDNRTITSYSEYVIDDLRHAARELGKLPWRGKWFTIVVAETKSGFTVCRLMREESLDDFEDDSSDTNELPF